MSTARYSGALGAALAVGVQLAGHGGAGLPLPHVTLPVESDLHVTSTSDVPR